MKDKLKEINEILERMEKKLDQAIALMQVEKPLNIKGYPVANLDWITQNNPYLH